MSFTLTTTIIRGSDRHSDSEAVQAKLEDVDLPDHAEAESRTLAEAALAAAGNLVALLGNEGDEVAVQVTGHANPGGVPPEGWSADCITVTLAAARPTT